MDISDDLEIEDKEKKAICTNAYDIINEHLFEKDKKKGLYLISKINVGDLS